MSSFATKIAVDRSHIEAVIMKVASVLKKRVEDAKKSGNPIVFLGGDCSDNNAWREKLKKEFGDKLALIDPYDDNWEADDNIYDELAAMVGADHVVFYRGGKGTKKEKEFLGEVSGDESYEEFDDLGDLHTYLSNLAKPVTVKTANDTSYEKYLLVTPGYNTGEYYSLDIPKGVDPPHKGDKLTLKGHRVEVATVSTPDNIRRGKGGPVATAMEANGIAYRVNCLPEGHEWLKTAKEGGVYKKSTTQVDLPDDMRDAVIAWGKKNLPDNELVEDEKGSMGREDEIHATVLFGIKDSVPGGVATVVKTFEPFEARLGLVTLFKDKKEHDVVKIDIEAPELHKLHYALLDAVPCESSFPTYVPHVTVAYVKKGAGDKVLGSDEFRGKTFKVDSITFKNADKEATRIPLKDIS